MDRFKMTFINSGTVSPQFNTLANRGVMVKPQNMALNAPMIDRVYKARPGCSACCKKVA
jgi:hypothetical protein